MEKQQRKRIRKYVSWVLIVAVVATLAFLPTIASQEEPESGPQASILSAAAQQRSISTAVLGGGILTAEDAVEITVPAAVKIKDYLVSNGDVVEEGQAIATVDRVSVMTAITQVQETMKDLQEQLNDAGSETASSEVTATAGGTVKNIYAAAGETVQDVMLRDGALAVLSLDGLMAVQIEKNTSLSGGDEVCVTLSDGTELDGRVESNLEGILTVTVEDKGFAAGEQVRVTTPDGDRIGSGELYIHNAWNVMAYSGTVSRIRVKEGDTVSAGQRLFDLKDIGHTAQFDSLSRKHREYEELMLDLSKMYQSETVTAPAAGMISGVDKDGAYMLSDNASGFRVTLLANGPGGDENEYVNFVGQVTEVGTDGLIMKMNPLPISVTDYHDLSGVPLNTELMTEVTIYSGSAPIYVLTETTVGGEPAATEPTAPSDPSAPTEVTEPSSTSTETQIIKEWVQISPYSIAAGDILLFAGGNSSGVVWVIRVSHADIQQPSKPSDSTRPEGEGAQSGNRPSTGGSSAGSRIPSGGGSMSQEEDSDLYALDTVTIASVTAQEQFTVQITVDELDISKISIGQSVQITLGALSGEKFTGSVSEISNSGTSEGGNSKFTVTVSVHKAENMLPGMTAHVSIVLSTAENAVCIPVAALTETGTETVVYTGYDEETEEFTGPVTVSTGKSDGEYVQILSGITDGQTVYYSYYDTLVIDTAPDSGSAFRF